MMPPIPNRDHRPKEIAINSRIYLSPPHLAGDELPTLEAVLKSNWIAPSGPALTAFEQSVAELTGRTHALAVNSCTAAMQLGLRAVGVGAGDLVATSTLTFVASANAIRYLGAVPVFIDSQEKDWNICPSLLSDAIGDAVNQGTPIRAVLSVDAFGQASDYGPLERICSEFSLPLVEDGAEALGAAYDGRPVGNFGKVSCLSFNGNKIITTSGGGMLLTDDTFLYQKAKHWASQARDDASHYEHSELGYNFRMSNVLAALGISQLSALEDRVAARRANFDFYRNSLGDLDGIAFMPEPPGYRSTRWLSVITIDPKLAGIDRESVRIALEEHNIESRPVWKPMHLQPLYRDCRNYGGQNSARFFQEGLCLPSGSSLTEEQRQRIVTVIRNCWSKNR